MHAALGTVPSTRSPRPRHEPRMSHACTQACRVELHPRSASQMRRQEFDPWSLADAPCSPVKLDDPGFRVSEDRITCLGIARARSRILVEPPIEQNSWSWYRTTSQPAPLDLAADTRDMGSHVSWIFLSRDIVKASFSTKESSQSWEGWPREVTRRYARLGGSSGPVTCFPHSHDTRLRNKTSQVACTQASPLSAAQRSPILHLPSGE